MFLRGRYSGSNRFRLGHQFINSNPDQVDAFRVAQNQDIRARFEQGGGGQYFPIQRSGFPITPFSGHAFTYFGFFGRLMSDKLEQ